MSSKSDAAANADLDAKWGTGTAGGWWLGAISAVTSGPGGDVTEITGGGYARQLISFDTASGRSKSNDVDITLPQATGDHPDIIAWGIYADETGGEPELIKEIDTPVPYDTDMQPVIEAGVLTISEPAWA